MPDNGVRREDATAIGESEAEAKVNVFIVTEESLFEAADGFEG
jgi:hypothetical protein